MPEAIYEEHDDASTGVLVFIPPFVHLQLWTASSSLFEPHVQEPRKSTASSDRNKVRARASLDFSVKGEKGDGGKKSSSRMSREQKLGRGKVSAAKISPWRDNFSEVTRFAWEGTTFG